jgi:hypothetical protein
MRPGLQVRGRLLGCVAGGAAIVPLLPIAADGTFSLDYHGTQDLGGSPATYEDKLQGRFTGTTAAGTLVSTLHVNQYSCYSGTVTWTAVQG